MPQAGFESTEVGVTGFQLNVKRTLYLQATTAGCFNLLFVIHFSIQNKCNVHNHLVF